MAVTESARLAQEARRLEEDASRALNQRLKYKCGELMSVVGEGLLQFGNGRVDAKGVEEKRLKDPVEGVDAAQ